MLFQHIEQYFASVRKSHLQCERKEAACQKQLIQGGQLTRANTYAKRTLVSVACVLAYLSPLAENVRARFESDAVDDRFGHCVRSKRLCAIETAVTLYVCEVYSKYSLFEKYAFIFLFNLISYWIRNKRQIEYMIVFIYLSIIKILTHCTTIA